MTKKLKKRYQSGESLDRLLPEAFAVMIEADDRVLKKRPYDVQVLAGIALHQEYRRGKDAGGDHAIVFKCALWKAMYSRNNQ